MSVTHFTDNDIDAGVKGVILQVRCQHDYQQVILSLSIYLSLLGTACHMEKTGQGESLHDVST